MMEERDTYQVRLRGLTHVEVEARGVKEAVEFAEERSDVGVELRENDLKNVSKHGAVQ